MSPRKDLPEGGVNFIKWSQCDLLEATRRSYLAVAAESIWPNNSSLGCSKSIAATRYGGHKCARVPQRFQTRMCGIIASRSDCSSEIGVDIPFRLGYLDVLERL